MQTDLVGVSWYIAIST